MAQPGDRHERDQRPDPDKLLGRITQEQETARRGRLKIFFGACAGVGKTYGMLRDAASRYEEGIDVLIGLVETHGREDTAKLVHGIPILERKRNLHRGVGIDEFDLDAAIERNPKLILLDELAHTNAPGSRHPKRWQDVRELLGHGIDVYTTLNVQHLESLNDVVARLTGVQVRETIPDSVFDEADDIVLVDIPPDELLKRLREGKVYIAEQAQKRAAENFFKKRNLIALRELALRRTAERVDQQMNVEDSAQLTALSESLHVTDKIMVLVGHDALSTRIIRHAKRWSIRLKVPWYAIYVETSRHYRLSERAQQMVERNLRLAERLGAQMQLLKGENAVEEILDFAYRNGATRIIVGRQKLSRLRAVIFGTLADKLIRNSKNIAITVVTDGEGRTADVGIRYSSLRRTFERPVRFAYAALAMVAVTIAALPFRGTPQQFNVALCHMAVVVAIAARYGTAPAIFATLLGTIFFNAFFADRSMAFDLAHSEHYFVFLIMALTSVVIGWMAGRLRLRAAFFRKREQEIERLFSLTKSLAWARGHTGMAEVAIQQIGEVFGATVTIWTPGPEGDLRLIGDGEAQNDLREKSAASWAFENKQDAGMGTDTLPGVKGLYIPLITEDQAVGVLGIVPETSRELDSEERNLLEAFGHLLASSLRRVSTAMDAEQSRIDAESEKLRNVMLSSISHDIRTPLSAINGLSSSILLSEPDLSKRTKEALRLIHEQTTKLGRIVTNLLDITSLESGRISLKRQPYYLEEVIGSSLLRIEPELKGRKVETEMQGTSGLIEIDGLLIEQVFLNLLENAIRFTKPDGGIITIKAAAGDDEVLVLVSDNGTGFTPGTEEKVFAKYYKGPSLAGTGGGLGLAICRSIITVHGGSIWAQNNEMGGATICILLPKLKANAPDRIL